MLKLLAEALPTLKDPFFLSHCKGKIYNKLSENSYVYM